MPPSQRKSALLKEMKKTVDFTFKTEELPEETSNHSRSLKRLMEDCGRVREEKYSGLLEKCEEWVKEGRAVGILRGALALLDGRTTTMSGEISKLSGRQGFIPLLAHDPDHAHLGDSQALIKFIKRFDKNNIGMVAKCRGGWVFDAKEEAIATLIEKSEKTDVPFRVVERMPRIVLDKRRFRRAPWARLQQRVREHGRKARGLIARRIQGKTVKT